MCFQCFFVLAFQMSEFLWYCLCYYGTYKWSPATCAMNCTNRTKCRLTFIFPQKMPYYCPVIPIMNTVACSGFLLFSINKLPPPPVLHLPSFCSSILLRTLNTWALPSAASVSEETQLLSSHTLAQTHKDFNFCSAAVRGEGLGRNGGWCAGRCDPRLLNGWLKPQLPNPPAEHSSALSPSWLRPALSASAPQATACEQVCCFWQGTLLSLFKSTYLYC